MIYDYFNNKWESDLEDRDIAKMLEETEGNIKNAKEFINKLVEEYEEYYVK